MLMHDMGKPATISVDEEGINHFYGHDEVGEKIARNIFRRLKFDRDTMDRVCNLILYHDWRFPAQEGNVRKAMHKVGERDFPLLFEIRYADTMAQSTFQREEKLALLRDTKAVYRRIIERDDCTNLKSLAVNGRDLIELGVSPGRELGKILNNMLMDVLEEPTHNTKEYLLEPERLRQFMKDL